MSRHPEPRADAASRRGSGRGRESARSWHDQDEVVGVNDARSIASRFYDAFNTRDLETYCSLLDVNVEVFVDAGVIVGPDAALAYATGVMRAFPGVVSKLARVVAADPDTIVSELRLVNPAAEVASPSSEPPAGTWLLAGLVCEIISVRDGRIVALRSYYAPHPDDRTPMAEVPSRAEAARLADEQTALRRVATLVARGVSQNEVFAAVNQEMARIVGADTTALMHFDSPNSVTLLAAWGSEKTSFPVGMRQTLDDELRAVRDTGRSSRFGPAEAAASGPFVDEARRLGVCSSVGVPIVLDGGVWGISYAALLRPEPLPDDTESRMAGFAELVATALANAQTRAALHSLADEQTSLRRVAELVARGAAQQAVLNAIVVEACELFGVDYTALTRYDDDEFSSIVALHNAPTGVAVGDRKSVTGDTLGVRVFRSGRPARVDTYARLPGPEAARARTHGVTAGAGAPILVEGRLWGFIAAMSRSDPVSVGLEDRLAQFAELAAAAIANAEHKAKLTASRARVVATADETRRRLQRDVHDGAQQRLVQTVITLKLAREAIAGGGSATELVNEALQHAERANTELRDLVRGILPASLSRGGLRAGLESLMADIAMPVQLRVAATRLAAATEITAYFIVTEALTNVVKHANATCAHIDVEIDDGELIIDVRDDGAGGADPTRGSGLTGLSDRVEAAGGILTINSPAGGGTALHATLPVPTRDLTESGSSTAQPRDPTQGSLR